MHCFIIIYYFYIFYIIIIFKYYIFYIIILLYIQTKQTNHSNFFQCVV